MINNNLHPKSAKMDIKIWPAVKFAANLIPKAIGLEILLAISITTKRGDNNKGAPEGIRELKNKTLKLWNPNIITPNQIPKAIPKVIKIWVVTGNVYVKNPSKFTPK